MKTRRSGVVFEQVERIIRPRIEHGSDWGSLRWVLARYGTKELWWLTSGKEWMGLLEGYQHRPGALIAITDVGSKVVHARPTYLHDSGGRLSHALLSEHHKAINEFFGCEMYMVLHPKRTVIARREEG